MVGMKSQHHTYPLIKSTQICLISHSFLNFFGLDSLFYAVLHLRDKYISYIFIKPQINAYIHTYADTYTHNQIQKHIRTYIHIDIHTYTRAHIHTHVHTLGHFWLG